ncbi:MAG: nucleoside monophosphate kinase [Kiritimatiellae bacterium]|nr:nucleoside monophosphate kinase [Kiritimatiellia bacterium]
MKNQRLKAILLLGATGAGKTPVGDFLEKEGVNNQRCFHFDFGSNLRAVAENPDSAQWLTQAEITVIAKSLSSGKLLENESFPIADKILQQFVSEKTLTEKDLLILNGLPRHVSQAMDVDAIVDVDRIIYLSCTPEVTKERIRRNTGGDRTERQDDSLEEIDRKVQIFLDRTIPILDHYRQKKVEISEYEIGINTQPEDIVQKYG